MKVATVYIYPPHPSYEPYVLRFLDSYHDNPPGTNHESIVVLNGTKPTSDLYCLFSSLPNLTFLEHDNSGYDIGGYQLAARTIPCDLMVFFSTSTYFFRPGWLLRMLFATERHGNAQYGAMGNRGDIPVKVWPHIRTTAFWMKPELMNGYPHRVTHPEQRHPFEHGQQCFTSWLTKQGVLSWVITWSRELLWRDWDADPNGFSRGNQSNLLAGDRMTEAPYYPRR